MSPSEQMEKPGTVNSSFVLKSSVRKELPLSMKLVFQVTLQPEGLLRAIWTVGRHVATTKVFLEENVLEGHDVGPRLTA